MRIITISREFGSGGRELGKRLSDQLGADYYDSEIITAVAKNCGMDSGYVASALEGHGWQRYPITYSRSFQSAGSRVELLLEQKKVLETIAQLGKDCVIVGRNADVILSQYQPLNLFVCAGTEAKLRRCMERAPAGEDLTEREMLRKMKQVDKGRSLTRDMLTDARWGQRDAYQFTINTTDWSLKELAPAVAELAQRWFGRAER